jgi:hypothetical protein
MSDDEGVMPFQVTFDVTPREVTLREGKGALGAWWTSLAISERDFDPTNPKIVVMSSGGVNLLSKGCMWANA